MVIIPCPNEPNDPINLVKRAIFNAEIKAFVSDKRKHNSNQHQGFSILIGQCTHNVFNNLKAMQEYKEMDDAAGILVLVELFNTIVYNFDDHMNVADALLAAYTTCLKYHQEMMIIKKSFIACRPSQGKSTVKCKEGFVVIDD